MNNQAAPGSHGQYADRFERVAQVFAENLANGDEIGASFAVYQHGVQVVDLWGGLADLESGAHWERNTRIVLFSVTKGFAAMAMNLLADRGLLEWDAPVADYWPGFAKNGKADISIGTLVGHRGGLAYLDKTLQMSDLTDSRASAKVLDALESQTPIWKPGTNQGYHAITFGMYVRELFERITQSSMGEFLTREIFDPLESDVRLGTPSFFDSKFATLYPPSAPTRVKKMVGAYVQAPRSAEAHVIREYLTRKSTMKRAFTNPTVPGNDLTLYNRSPVRRAELAFGSATGTADGIARAYLPFAQHGSFGGRQFIRRETLEPVYTRLGWSDHDQVLQKPLGWSNGFLKEETTVFSPNPESFGHAGMGGALGWADPTAGITIGYAPNKMDWRVRSLRAKALCRAVYDCLED
jgi:CubicO group peptidase (beta-lactamase class C family)